MCLFSGISDVENVFVLFHDVRYVKYAYWGNQLAPRLQSSIVVIDEVDIVWLNNTFRRERPLTWGTDTSSVLDLHQNCQFVGC